MKVALLRIVHSLFTVYFLMCLAYLYYAGISGVFNALLLIAVVSLGAEGIVVFILNQGDCPLIHIQRRLGDDKPFFELFLPKHIAKRAIPFFAVLSWVAVGLLIVRLASRFG
jgi:hypothetical protein